MKHSRAAAAFQEELSRVEQCQRSQGRSSHHKASTPRDDIVVTVVGNRTGRLNAEPVRLEDLDARLRGIFKNAPNHVILVHAEKDLSFQYVAEVIDIAKGAGLERVA